MDYYTRPNWSRCAVVNIDMQNDFVWPESPTEIPGTQDIVPNTGQLLKHCRVLQIPIIHVIRLYLPDGSNVDLCRRSQIKEFPGMVAPGSIGAEVVAPLLPQGAAPMDSVALLQGEMQSVAEKEWMLYKPRWGAFFQTKLEAWLKGNRINTLIFTGCNFPNCPRTTIYQASERDFKVVAVADALSGIYNKGLEEIRKIGCAIYTVEELLDVLRPVGKKS